MTTVEPSQAAEAREAAYRAWRARWEPLRRFFVWYFRIRATGVEQIPPSGPAILAPNHGSILDPAILVSVCGRRMTTLGKAGLFRTPLLSTFLRAWGGRPIERETADVWAAREAFRVLRAGHALVLYPERTRTRTGELGPFTTGAAALALATGAPLVPIGIWGSFQALPPRAIFPRRHPVGVAVGAPIDLTPWTGLSRSSEAVAAVTARLRQRVAELIELARSLHRSDG